MKYIFKQISDYGVKAESTVEFEADSLSDILEQFQFFLKGCGFHFNGNIDINEEDSMVNYQGDGHEGMGSLLSDFPNLEPEHSDYYYDTERNREPTTLITTRGSDSYQNFLKEYDREGNKSK